MNFSNASVESALYRRQFFGSVESATPVAGGSSNEEKPRAGSTYQQLLTNPLGAPYLNSLSPDQDLRISSLNQVELIRKQISEILQLSQNNKTSPSCCCFGSSPPSKKVNDCLLRLKPYSLDEDAGSDDDTFPDSKQRAEDTRFFSTCGAITSDRRLQINISCAITLFQDLSRLYNEIERITIEAQRYRQAAFSPTESIYVKSAMND